MFGVPPTGWAYTPECSPSHFANFSPPLAGEDLAEDLTEDLAETISSFLVCPIGAPVLVCPIAAPPSPLPMAGNPRSSKLLLPGVLLGSLSPYSVRNFLSNAFCDSVALICASSFLPPNTGEPKWSVFDFSALDLLPVAFSQNALAVASIEPSAFSWALLLEKSGNVGASGVPILKLWNLLCLSGTWTALFPVLISVAVDASADGPPILVCAAASADCGPMLVCDAASINAAVPPVSDAAWRTAVFFTSSSFRFSSSSAISPWFKSCNAVIYGLSRTRLAIRFG